MGELAAKSPCDGLLPLSIGDCAVEELSPGALTALAPYRGEDKALAQVLKARHNLLMPQPGRATGKEGARAIWFGQRMILLIGPEPDESLAQYAAVTDQSDAWAVVRLQGAGARDVLARLTPVDLRETQFKRGHTARTDLRHMMASLTRIGPESYMIMVFRGFAETLVHDLRSAMQSVAAR